MIFIKRLKLYQILKNASGSTMIELMVVLAILGLGVAGLLQTIGSGGYFARDTENNIKAINIAREGIEGVMNIRDTNWLRFSSDRRNCWITKNYDGGCINTPNYTGLYTSGSYILYNRNGAWYLSGITNPPNFSSNWQSYKSTFAVGIDNDGFWSQTGGSLGNPCSNLSQTGCLSIFAREIQLNVISSGTLSVTSIVRWKERRDMNVILNTTLTNWKSNF